MLDERVILLEDGTVWDGSDPEEPALVRRLLLCEPCRTVFANPERIRGRQETCLGIVRSKDSGMADLEGEEEDENEARPCAARAMALAGLDKTNKQRLERFLHFSDSVSKYDLVQISSDITLALASCRKKGTDFDVTGLGLSFGNGTFGLDVHAHPVPPFIDRLNETANNAEGAARQKQDDPAAEYVTTRPAMADMARESATQIKAWIENCCLEHAACPEPTDKPLPSRVIDVGLEPAGTDNVYVRETQGERGKYIALSYCWGGSQPLLLKKDTYAWMTSAGAIELMHLPLTIRDAVKVTRDLGLRYLWVDALCIIQDCGNDMHRELGMMASVFKHAYTTISAASAKTSQDGFLHYRMPMRSQFPRFELPFKAWENGPAGRVIVEEARQYWSYSEPVNLRAWCFQESLLSPRLVIFGTSNLVWQCGLKTAEEPLIAGSAVQVYENGLQRLDPAFFDPVKYKISPVIWTYSWEDVVISYSPREMSFEEDKLVAVGGLAAEHQRLSDGDEYVAGLWRRNLPLWLGWFVDPCPEADRIHGSQKLQARPSAYVAPSWSWASVRGILCFSVGNNPRGEVVRCEVTLQDEGLPFGAVTGGEVVLRLRRKETRWSGKTILESAEAGSEPAGNAWMDADEEKPEVVSCLELFKDNGLIVVKADATTYKRVGVYELRGMKEVDWFDGCEVEDITLV